MHTCKGMWQTALLWKCPNVKGRYHIKPWLACSPPVSLDDHSDAFTVVMKLSDLNKRSDIIDLIQVTYHIIFIARGNKNTCTYILTNCTDIHVHVYVHVSTQQYAMN